MIDDSRIIPMPPIPKQVSILEQSKIIELVQKTDKSKVVDLL